LLLSPYTIAAVELPVTINTASVTKNSAKYDENRLSVLTLFSSLFLFLFIICYLLFPVVRYIGNAKE
jgi:hypothetical protein